jgi:hypothetical protein
MVEIQALVVIFAHAPCKAAQILKAAVPALEKIRDEHQSERLRKGAAKYLEQIAREVGV